MKKNIILLLTSLICLSSCELGKTRPVYKSYINDEYNLRVLQYREDATTIDVDEYYYTADVYSGDIKINVTIPDEIDGMEVTKMQRQFLYYVADSITGHPIGHHDQATRTGDVEFEFICYSFFEEGTTFDITINIGANISEIYLNTWQQIYIDEIAYYILHFGKNGEKKEETNVRQLFPCNLYFNVSENNVKYCSKNGILYLKEKNVPLYKAVKFVEVEQNQYLSDYNMNVND